MLQLVIGVLWAVAGGVSAEHQRGLDLYKEQKYAEAVQALEQAAKGENAQSAEFRESALLIGQSYFLLSQAPKAIPWLERVPGVNEANYMLGYAYLQAKEQDKSRQAFARLFGVEANSAAGHLVAGQMMLKKDFAEQALGGDSTRDRAGPEAAAGAFPVGGDCDCPGKGGRGNRGNERGTAAQSEFFDGVVTAGGMRIAGRRSGGRPFRTCSGRCG